MKLYQLLLLICFFVLHSVQAQKFKKGYYVTCEGERIDCEIKERKSPSTPQNLDCRANENAEEKRVRREDMCEFGLGEEKKFIKETVSIDRTPYNPDYAVPASTTRKPVFNKEELMLQVLVEGDDASLYAYYDDKGYFKRFFMKLKNFDTLQQLIFKRYYFYDPDTALDRKDIHINESFKQQLLLQLKCDDLTEKDATGTRYTASSLKKTIIKYNNCKGTDYTEFDR